MTIYLIDGKKYRQCDCPPREGKCRQGKERRDLGATELSRCLLPAEEAMIAVSASAPSHEGHAAGPAVAAPEWLVSEPNNPKHFYPTIPFMNKQVRSMMHATDHLPHGHFIIEFMDGTQKEFEHFSEFGAWIMEALRAQPTLTQEEEVMLRLAVHIAGNSATRGIEGYDVFNPDEWTALRSKLLKSSKVEG